MKHRAFPLILFAAAYLLLIFPFAFFRHDDWIILANGAVHLPRDWGFAFKPTLMMAGIEEVWFFRPFFKGILYIVYQLFGLNYFLWLTLTLAITAGAIALGASALTRIRDDARLGRLFQQIFCGAAFLHFGSLVWAGEGLMNCPQLFLLALNTYCVVRARNEKSQTARFGWLTVGFLSWFLSLGFKESGVFHTAFLFALFYQEPFFRKFSLQRKIKWFLPYAIGAIGFLIIRLKFMPITQGYVPEFTLKAIGLPIAVLAVSLILPFVVFPMVWKKLIQSARSRWLYAPFFLAAVLPYIGHPFFSPGWLLFPGFYAVFFLGLIYPMEARKSQTYVPRAAAALVSISLIVLGIRLTQVGWWHWGQAQRKVLSELRKLPSDTAMIDIHHCVSEKFPAATMERVAASEHALFHMWEFLHGNGVKVRLWDCDYRVPASMQPSGTVTMRWHFPNFERLR